ncbi:hypothetical protein [Nostoc sp. FACHB-280]|uniref:hypothetical protein n=1 Tax=Nostoc sp. FACHB-280 TaxID=2692839 RepID=UPI00168BE2F6|nr:hypothetical protein [Nostoc sp. FACHB-280]MBD2498926.1 hypothetical protein [Nostoc sp. FACHB-280]
MIKRKLQLKLTRDNVLGIAVLVMVTGTLILAFIDPTVRPFLFDLTQMALGAYLGLKAGDK